MLNAGVGNYNLVRLSSILPLDSTMKRDIELPYGALLPIAYAEISTNTAGERVSAAVAIGFPKEENACGVIMEYEGICSQEKAELIVADMVKEGFSKRGWTLDRIDMKSSSAESHGDYATAFACVAEWEE